MSPKKYLMVVSAIISLFSGSANATIVTFQFTGTVTYGGTLADTDSQVIGIFSYDDSTLPAYSYKGFANYAIPAPFAISVSVGGHTVMASNLNVSIWDNYGGNVEDMVDVTSGPVFVDDSYYPNGSVGFRLASKPGNTRVITRTSLPSFLDVRAFDADKSLNYGWLQSDGAEGGQLLQFSIDSIVNPQKCKNGEKGMKYGVLSH